jgi:hypothetical protein
MPPAFNPNRYPIRIEFLESPARLELALDDGYVDMGLEGEVRSNLLENLPEGPKVLVWKEGKFVWQ